MRKITPPHPTLMLMTMILAILNLWLFLPEKYNYYNWVGWLWTGFWWFWLFPFLFVKIYDWSHVRSLRKGNGGGGAGSPMWRMLGFMIVAMVIGILVLILILNVIGYILSMGR